MEAASQVGFILVFLFDYQVHISELKTLCFSFIGWAWQGRIFILFLLKALSRDFLDLL
jgi:hypothetical protein